jgi:hypothetical protein
VYSSYFCLHRHRTGTPIFIFVVVIVRFLNCDNDHGFN